VHNVGWFATRRSVFTARYGLYLSIKLITFYLERAECWSHFCVNFLEDVCALEYIYVCVTRHYHYCRQQDCLPTATDVTWLYAELCLFALFEMCVVTFILAMSCYRICMLKSSPGLFSWHRSSCCVVLVYYFVWPTSFVTCLLCPVLCAGTSDATLCIISGPTGSGRQRWPDKIILL
jgi:hypothetical protein